MEKRRRRTDYRKLSLLGLGAFVAVALFMFLSQNSGKIGGAVDAANLAEFNPGLIISDFQMTDYNSMNEGEIQNFLWSKGNCRNTNFDGVSAQVNYFSDSTPPTTWHVDNGHTVCMADENINGESAAHIIWQAAQDYHINPKVLIVLIQKETGLVTDPVPNSGNYQTVAGYGCPDTAACSEKYFGFKNQIRNAAELFRIVMDGNSSHYPIGHNYVQYNPNPGCGGSVVYIQNLATSALYRYTPYQPNAGALAAGYGTAPCGAYGNRNFFSYFQDWFGSITWDGWPSRETALSVNRVEPAGSDLDVKYVAHITHYGWLDWVDNGAMSGTAGLGARMEAFAIELEDSESGIEYQSHVAKKGWLGYVKNGAMSGTANEGLQMEAMQIRLTGEMAKLYDIYYRVHVAGIGWMDWVKNDEIAGTTGQSRQVEAMQVKLVRKNQGNNITYHTHVQDIGWQGWMKEGENAGTVGQSRRVEALAIETANWNVVKNEELVYQTHVAGIGWMGWLKGGQVAGTTGQSRQVEAIMIELSNEELKKKYDIYYRTHVQNIGWMNWVKNGEISGTTGRSLRVEALQIELVKK